MAATNKKPKSFLANNKLFKHAVPRSSTGIGLPARNPQPAAWPTVGGGGGVLLAHQPQISRPGSTALGLKKVLAACQILCISCAKQDDCYRATFPTQFTTGTVNASLCFPLLARAFAPNTLARVHGPGDKGPALWPDHHARLCRQQQPLSATLPLSFRLSPLYLRFVLPVPSTRQCGRVRSAVSGNKDRSLELQFADKADQRIYNQWRITASHITTYAQRTLQSTHSA